MKYTYTIGYETTEERYAKDLRDGTFYSTAYQEGYEARKEEMREVEKLKEESEYARGYNARDIEKSYIDYGKGYSDAQNDGYEKAWKAGYDSAYDEGYEEGYAAIETAVGKWVLCEEEQEEGLATSYDEGWHEGYEDGFEQCREEGFEAAYDEGYGNGEESGKKKGYLRALADIAEQEG